MLTEKILVQIKFRETSTLIKHWSNITLGSYSVNNHSGKIIFFIIHNVRIKRLHLCKHRCTHVNVFLWLILVCTPSRANEKIHHGTKSISEVGARSGSRTGYDHDCPLHHGSLE